MRRLRRLAGVRGGARVGPALLFLFAPPLPGLAQRPAGPAAHTAAAQRAVVSLDLTAERETVELLVAAKTTDGHELRHQRSRDGGVTWSAATRLPLDPAPCTRRTAAATPGSAHWAQPRDRSPLTRSRLTCAVVRSLTATPAGSV